MCQLFSHSSYWRADNCIPHSVPLPASFQLSCWPPAKIKIIHDLPVTFDSVGHSLKDWSRLCLTNQLYFGTTGCTSIQPLNTLMVYSRISLVNQCKTLCCNRQPWIYLFLMQRWGKESLTRVTGSFFIKPVLFSDSTKKKKKKETDSIKLECISSPLHFKELKM